MAQRLSKAERQALEKKFDRKYTERQINFAMFMAEGTKSASQCARLAGYSEAVAGKRAYFLMDGVSFPHVAAYVEELREARARQYGVTTMGQLERLAILSEGAEKAGQYSSAISAEKLRSALGGLTTDRRESINKMDDLSKAEIIARLLTLQKSYPQILKDVTNSTPVLEGRSEELEDE